MARPIKETPVLTGDDAVRFVLESQNIEPISQEEKEEAQRIYDYFASIANFTL